MFWGGLGISVAEMADREYISMIIGLYVHNSYVEATFANLKTKKYVLPSAFM